MPQPHLPSIDLLVRQLHADGLPRHLVVEAAREAVAAARADAGIDPRQRAEATVAALRRSRPQRVVNATGVMLHTNLGRAPLHPEAAEAARQAAVGYGNVELDLTSGDRGSRAGYLRRLLATLCRAEAALAVNNNAAAVFLALTALGEQGRVPVSRGELIEIGGSYRLPELMEAAGVELVEVGTTNRTRLGDYRRAVGEPVALLLKVHPSNYRIEGFVEEAPLSELARLAAEIGVPLLFDAGSGLVDDRTPWLPGPPPRWLAGEPGVVQALEQGADLVTFSGDKLFGGPQAGIVVGRGDLVERIRRHPAARAMRLDGPTLAALTVTAERYADGTAAELPFWRMATTSYQELEQRAQRLLTDAGVDADLEPGASTVGAGSVPGAEVPTPLVAPKGSADRIFTRLLAADPPVLARREAGRLLIDLRTVDPADDPHLAAALSAACRS